MINLWRFNQTASVSKFAFHNAVKQFQCKHESIFESSRKS